MTDNGIYPGGALAVLKPAGFTSHDVVGKIRKLFNTRQVGHTGTLDPMATGVLIVLIGRAVKASEYLSVHDKTYVAGMKLGIETDTQDISGTVLLRTAENELPSEAEVLGILSNFRGVIEQVPPMYSAKKVAGRKLVDLARKGQDIERKGQEINIYSLSCECVNAPDEYRLEVSCSSGTYIRTLCHDIGRALGCGAVMTSLERTAIGTWNIGDCLTLESIENVPPENRTDLLIPVENLFGDCPAVPLPEFYAGLIRNGCAVQVEKLKKYLPKDEGYSTGRKFRLYHPTKEAAEEFFALGAITEDEEGPALKALKIFAL